MKFCVFIIAFNLSAGEPTQAARTCSGGGEEPQLGSPRR